MICEEMADLIVVQQTVNNILYEEVKLLKAFTKEAGCSEGLSQGYSWKV